MKVKVKGIFNQRLIINGIANKKTTLCIKLNDKVYFEQVYKKGEIIDISRDLIDYDIIDIYLNQEKYKSFNQKKVKKVFTRLYKVLGLSKLEKFFKLVKKAFYFAWHRHHLLIPPKALKQYIKSFFVVLKRNNGNTSNLYTSQSAYLKWIENTSVDEKIEKLKYNPLFSIIIPTYNVSRKLLSECLDSILNQTYTNFEVCIADDHSTKQETIDTLHDYEKKDKRIHVTYRKENGMISASSNTALKNSHGEFIVLVDNDDTIEKDALYLFAKALNENNKLDFIYSDEDKLDLNGKRCEPHFKPDWSPDTFMCLNYICHLTMIRKSLVDEVGGFRSEFDGSQDYDLFLRILEKTNNIYHIPRVLYHWRMSPTSTAGYMGNKTYTKSASQKALEESLKRRGIKGHVYENPRVNAYLVDYEHNNPLVSIIIPTRDHASITRKCLEGLFERTDYKNIEVIVVDNGSVEKSTIDLFDEYKKKYKNFKVVRIECEFNYSYLNNCGVKEAKGEFVLLLNNDTEVIENDWLDKMVGEASLPKTGCVGIKLLYSDKKVQHAGVVLGYGGVAGHIFVSCSRNDNGLFGRLAMPYNYSAVTAACLLVKRSIYDEVGGLDENLTVALNDVDFCLKVLEKGYFNVCMSNITMYHHESKSRGYEVTKEKSLRFEREKNYMIKKWGEEYFKEDKYFSQNNF